MEEEYQLAVRQVAFAAELVRKVNIPKILAAINMAESIGPIADPTLYRKKSAAMQSDKKLLEAARDLWQWAQVK